MNKRLLNLEHVIEKALKSEAEKIELPPKENIWTNIEKEISYNKSGARKKYLALKIVVVSIVFAASLGALAGVFPGTHASAVGKRIVKVVQTVFGEDTRIERISREISPPSDEPAIPKDNDSVEVIQAPGPQIFHDVEEARGVIPFTFRIPGYVPQGYKLESITYSGDSQETGEVVVRYKSDEGEFMITENRLLGEFATSSYFKSEEATVKEIDINGEEGTLISFKNGYNEVEYYSLGFNTRIIGKLDSQEIIKIAESLQ